MTVDVGSLRGSLDRLRLRFAHQQGITRGWIHTIVKTTLISYYPTVPIVVIVHPHQAMRSAAIRHIDYFYLLLGLGVEHIDSALISKRSARDPRHYSQSAREFRHLVT